MWHLNMDRSLASTGHLSRLRQELRKDDARFLRNWIKNPLRMGAVTPSGPVLARRMASYVDPHSTGPVIELGPGTGPVTQALIAHGVAEERLILVEFSPEFCHLLRQRFPKATVIQGDAYHLKHTLGETLKEPAAAVVSGLPLVTRPERVRATLVQEAFTMMQAAAPFIQFTYAMTSPVPLLHAAVRAIASRRIWRNMPPARVWVYRQGA
jgi:phosphatidylethanolamine/phosphatidyl-N-methylethanolamine N-methyltransferase